VVVERIEALAVDVDRIGVVLAGLSVLPTDRGFTYQPHVFFFNRAPPDHRR
jgi:hypothetical protein